MDFLRGFAWPVPTAFGGAVGACRFEQGDVLYSDASAYAAWTDGQSEAADWLQVLDPPKSARALGGEAEGNRFSSSWISRVELDWMSAGGGQPQRIRTTQGRLFTCLWRGDPALLEPESEAPPPPLLGRDLHARLAEAVPAFRRAFEASGGGAGRALLLMVLDQSADASRIKVRAVESALAEAFSLTAHDLSPVDAGVGEAEAFHPALLLRGWAIAGADASAIEARAKAVLYSAGEGKADRFALARHAHLAD